VANPNQIRIAVRSAIRAARFPLDKRNSVEDIIVRAICHYRLYRLRTKNNAAPIPGRTNFNPTLRKRGPKDKKDERIYLLSELFYAWLVGFGDYPKINNKFYSASPFVRFIEPILHDEGISRIEGNLDEYRAYRKKQLLASGFTLTRGKVN
jgi:hypothetical protein